MKKTIILLMICLISGGMLKAQMRIGNDRRVNLSKIVSMGVKFGVNDATMVYTDKQLKDLNSTYSIKPSFGLYLEIPVTRWLSVSPELMYIGRGGMVSYETNNTNNVDYKINSRCVDFRVPIDLYMIMSRSFKPYVFVAPDFGYVLGGEISMKQDGVTAVSQEIEIGSANMKEYNVSVLFGLGFRFDVYMPQTALYVKLEAGYNYGLTDTFSKMEKDESSVAENVNAYNISGDRFNRGLEVMISIGMPFYRNTGTCSTFRKANRW
ncbi:MAG: PorT family protein [Bacteroidales bacterium]|nr:PorT family protein [Bacteroidales bacterium]